MAKIGLEGLDDFQRRLMRHEQAATEAIPEMLQAGADVLIEAEKAEIERYNLIDKHKMINSVRATKVKKKGADSYVEVYPQGKDAKGVRNATKGFIAQYGRSTQEAKPWHSDAIEKSSDEVRQAMAEKWAQKTSE